MSSKQVATFTKIFMVVAIAMLTVYSITNYAILKRSVDEKLLQLDRSASIIASQIKSANLNSILAFTDEFYIFILNHRDGRVLFESAKRQGEEAIVWETVKPAILSEIIKNKNGVIFFPERENWQLLSFQKTVRYLYLDDLDWIVLIELPAHVTWKDFSLAFSPVACGILGFVCFFFSLILMAVKKVPEPVSSVTSEDTRKPQDKRGESTSRLAEEAKKILNSDALERDQPKIAEQTKINIKQDVLTEVKALEKRGELSEEINKKPDKKSDNIEILNEVKIDESSDIAEPLKEEPKDTLKHKPVEKSASEIYFDNIMSGKKKDAGKPQPASIIGIALSKKSNREKMDI